jgi:hypothetical protein
MLFQSFNQSFNQSVLLVSIATTVSPNHAIDVAK